MTVLSTEPSQRTRFVALVGNPNTGKTSLFNVLTGFRQRVGNYAGVTVEKKTGPIRGEPGWPKLEAIDLPGTYSLAASSVDEAVVLDVLVGRQSGAPLPDVIVVVVDTTNLARNLFLVSQLLELGRPLVVALNMVDLARRSGLVVDTEKLSRELGAPVVEVVATKGIGIDKLKRAIVATERPSSPASAPTFPPCVHEEVDGLAASVAAKRNGATWSMSRVELLQSLLGPGGRHEAALTGHGGGELAQELAQRRGRIAAAGESVSEVEANVRYAWIKRIVDGTVSGSAQDRTSISERIDRVLTHRVLGLLIFLVMMGLCFQAIYTWAAPVMDAIEGGIGWLGSAVATVLPPGALRSLIINGVFAGVGAVLVFLPQILILFLFIAVLEDCGYMARAAFLVDRWMGFLGLSGKSFIPLLSSFACAVPGILATRTIEDRRDRFITILIAPLMSCSARLPVYILLISAFVPATALLGGVIGLQAVVLLSMYVLGTFVAIGVALVLRKTVLKGESQPFLMELPTYKWPSAKTVLYRAYEQGKAFCVSAGTIIFAVTIVVWALGYYPRPASVAATFEAERMEAREAAGPEAGPLEEKLQEIDRREAGAFLRQSFLGRMGRWIEPAVEPLGWDWRIGTAAIASFPAREVVIATMGTIYNLGGDQDESSASLRDKLRAATWPDGRPVFTLAVALSIMVFFLLCCQCGATLATIKRETRSWRWPLFTFVYMTTLAYLGAFATYQIASRLV